MRKLSGMESTGYSRPKNSPDQIAIGYENNNETWGKPTELKRNEQMAFLHLLGNVRLLLTNKDLFKWKWKTAK